LTPINSERPLADQAFGVRLSPVRHLGSLDAPNAQFSAWIALAVLNAIVIAASVRAPLGGATVRALHHVYDAGQLAGVGVLAWAISASWHRYGPARPIWARLALFGAALISGFAFASDDTVVLAGKLTIASGLPGGAVQVGLLAALAASVALAATTGDLLRRRRLWLPAVIGFALAAIGNHFVLARDYPGIHAFAAAGAATLLGCAIADSSTERAAARIPHAAALLIGAFTLLVPPDDAVALELHRSSGSVVAPLVARLRSDAPVPGTTGSRDPWLSSRASAAPIPPSGPALAPGRPILILVTIDCLRADALGPKHLHRFPALARLASESVVFSEARSVAPSTLAAIASLFSGRYISELHWEHDPELHPVYPYPHLDPTPRFPEILEAAGVVTISIQGLPGIAERTGLVRGFARERFVAHPHVFAGAREMTPVVLAELGRALPGPSFLYAHFEDPHAPYDRSGVSGDDFERYLGEVAVVDRAIGQLVEELERFQVWPRTALIVTADHGEAFGEHGSTSHATTLYEELLRVPLLIRVPNTKPRVVSTRVSLIDIAPTILDLFGRATPGSYKGQSLVPFLRGSTPRLGRPLAFESSRHMRAMIFADGYKLIEDRRKRTLELYDLRRDPGELAPLDARTPAGLERIEQLRRFFGVHAFARDGYELPFIR
jgi:arylsulfatase A-like enzyme